MLSGSILGRRTSGMRNSPRRKVVIGYWSSKFERQLVLQLVFEVVSIQSLLAFCWLCKFTQLIALRLLCDVWFGGHGVD